MKTPQIPAQWSKHGQTEEPKPAPAANWYTSSTTDDVQGIIINQKTGQTIAVCYNPAHAALIAAAPDLLTVLEKASTCFTGYNLLSTATEEEKLKTIKNFLDWWNYEAIPAIQYATS